MSAKDDLQFHDSGNDDDVLFDQSGGQTHTFTNFPESAVDIEEDEGGDKSQLLTGEKKPASFWTFEYYQQFFDVETRQVFHRVAGSMLPIPKKNYLQDHIRPNPDLYGPFWICTTLVFTTAIAGNLANYLSAGGQDYKWRYDFHKVTFAATAIFSYWWIIPAVLYGVLWWRKSEAGYTFLEILCVYGYSLAIYIPISILWVVNVTWFKWTLVVVGALLSGGVLVLTFWPAVQQETKKVACIIIAIMFILHLALAAGFVLYFFHIPPPDQTKTTVAPPTTKVAPSVKESQTGLQQAQNEAKAQIEAKGTPDTAGKKTNAKTQTDVKQPSSDLPVGSKEKVQNKEKPNEEPTNVATDNTEHIRSTSNENNAEDKTVNKRSHTKLTEALISKAKILVQ